MSVRVARNGLVVLGAAMLSSSAVLGMYLEMRRLTREHDMERAILEKEERESWWRREVGGIALDRRRAPASLAGGLTAAAIRR